MTGRPMPSIDEIDQLKHSNHLLTQEVQSLSTQLSKMTADLYALVDQLHTRDREFYGLMERSNDGISLTDEEGRITEWNRALEMISGIPRMEALGHFIWEVQFRLLPKHIKSPDIFELLHQQTLEFLRTGQEPTLSKEHAEYEIQRPYGTKCVIQSSAFAIPTHKGYMIGAITRDVTNDQHMLHELRKLSRVVEQSPISVVITNALGECEYVNPKFTQLTGYTIDEMKGTLPDILTSDYHTPEKLSDLWDTITSGNEWREDLINRKKNGEPFWERVTISGVKDALGHITHYILIKEDITASKHAEYALADANKRLISLNGFLSFISSSLDPDEILEKTCAELAKVLGVPYAFVAQLDDKGKAAVVNAEYNERGYPSIIGVELPVAGSPLFTNLVTTRRPIAIAKQDASSKTLVHPEFYAKVLEHRSTTALMIVPVTIKNDVIALMGLESSAARIFSSDEIEMANTLVRSISKILENSYLHRALADHNSDLEEMVWERNDQLTRLNRRMGAILNNITDSIILTTAEGKIDMTNPAFSRQFLYDHDELFGQSVSVVVDDTYANKVIETVQAVAKDGKPRSMELIAKRNGGGVFDAELAMRQVIDDEPHVICNLHDISHLKEVERMKTRFISTVSHELRTPITALLLGAENLSQYYERMSDERKHRSVTQLHTQAKIMADLVEAILDISRVESRQGRRGETPVDMRKVLAGIIAEIQPSIEAKALEMDIAYPDAAMVVVGDYTDFSHVWRNLVGNAIKYTPAQGRISLRMGIVNRISPTEVTMPDYLTGFDPDGIDQNGKFLVGVVEDTGHGIGQADIQSLFTRFYRGWASQSNIPGTGLGLALVKDVVNLYGGGIIVRSELNVGSTFSFWLPMGSEQNEEITKWQGYSS